MMRAKSKPDARSNPLKDWRNDPATEEQRAYADDLGIDYPADIGRGELLDLLLARIERPPKGCFQLLSRALLWTSEKPKPRFQFSLRKLLLWVAMVALLLGVAKMVEVWLFVPACWIIIAGSIQLATSSKVARRVSVGAGLALAILGLLFALWQSPVGRPTGAEVIVPLVVLLLIGYVLGRTLFVVADVLCFGVDWIDKLFSRLDPKNS